MRSWSVHWGVIILLVAFGCGADEPEREIPPITWSGAHLDYAPQPGAYELCAGTLPYMDRYVELVADAMGVELDRRLTYVHGPGGELSFCEREGVDCAYADSVYSKVAPQEHELVHGVRAWHGFSQMFFEEGTAEVFGDDAHYGQRVTSNGDMMEGIEVASDEDGLPLGWYPRAGHFVAHLQERYGPEVTQTLLQQTNWDSGVPRTIAVIENETGVEWEEIVAEYEKEPECAQAQYRYPLYGCEEPTALRARCDGDDKLWITERLGCDDPETLGPRSGEIWKTIAVEIPEDGEYRAGLQVDGIQPARLCGRRLRRCDDCRCGQAGGGEQDRRLRAGTSKAVPRRLRRGHGNRVHAAELRRGRQRRRLRLVARVRIMVLQPTGPRQQRGDQRRERQLHRGASNRRVRRVLLGSQASGCQPGMCSTLAVLADPVLGLASLENLELYAAGSAEVGTEDVVFTVDGFAVRLWDSTPALLDEEGVTLEIPPGAAWFAASATSEGIPGVVNATNETALTLTKTAGGGWASSAFAIGHENGMGHWTLVVSPAQWQ